MKVIYSNTYKQDVINAFGLKSKDGIIIDAKTGNPILDNTGAKVTKKSFSGVRKGSIEYINNDVSSLIGLRNKLVNK